MSTHDNFKSLLQMMLKAAARRDIANLERKAGQDERRAARKAGHLVGGKRKAARASARAATQRQAAEDARERLER